MQRIAISGQRFGRLIAIEPIASSKSWRCVCDCGAQKTVDGYHLRNGRIRSCGCLLKEWHAVAGDSPKFVNQRNKGVSRHGHAKHGHLTPEYRIWIRLKNVCYNENHRDYPKFGELGIRVCDRWKDSFETFLGDMGSRPTEYHAIHRTDARGDFCLENCVWATGRPNGTRYVHSADRVTVNSVSYPSKKAACAALEISYGALLMRVRRGAGVEEAILSLNAERVLRQAAPTSYE
jgi:hypothetical protein